MIAYGKMEKIFFQDTRKYIKSKWDMNRHFFSGSDFQVGRHHRTLLDYANMNEKFSQNLQTGLIPNNT